MSNFDIDKIVKQRGKTPLNGWLYIFVLFLSFVWCSCYTVETSLSGYIFTSPGKLFQFSSMNFYYEIALILAISVIYVTIFELAFYVYRFMISFKVYSFIIPLERLKADARMVYAFRNLLYGIFMNLCFLFPFLESYAMFASLLFTMIMMIDYAITINKVYAEPLIAHFVFKTFMYPVFLFEILTMLFNVGGILL